MQFIAKIIKLKAIIRSCPRLGETNCIGHDIDLAEAEINNLLTEIYSEGYNDGAEVTIREIEKHI